MTIARLSGALEAGEWNLRAVVEGRHKTAGSFVGFDVPRQLHQQVAVFVFEDHVKGKEGIELVVQLLGQVYRALGGAWRQQWGFQFDRADILEESGQPTGWSVPRPISTAVQAPSPSALEGLTLIPSGRVTFALRSGGVARERSR